jgi:two-component system, chemotaxis family, sensor kinase CheA
MDDNSQYLDMFYEETDDNLMKLNDLVLDLEHNPTDLSIVDEIFRSAHTLKGMAATMGFTTMTEVTHKLENVFSFLKEKNQAANETIITIVLKSLDALAEIMDRIRAGESDSGDYSDIIAMCDKVTSEGATANQPTEAAVEAAIVSTMTLDDSDWEVAKSAQKDGYKAYTIAVKIESDSMMANARAFLVMSKLEEFGEIIKTEPSPDVLETDDFGHLFKCLYFSEIDEASIVETIKQISEVETVVINKLQKEETTVKKEEQNTQVTAKKAAANHQPNHSIRVDIDKLDSFMSLVSELVVYRTQLEDISQKTANQQLEETLTYVSRITNELQSLVLNIRMQPLQTVTNRFPRLVRDLSSDAGKPMDLVIEGDDTELDRTIVSELGEPLIHLIRNSADHGIENPERRLELGKDVRGTIKISAYQEGNRVLISVSDDGKGLDAEAIKASAERKGISTDGLTTQEIQELIFHPGFSTKQEVTKVSGRGVGMDVVKTKIQELGGSIDIVSEPNKGTIFRLSLPLTLSIIPVLLVKVEEHTLAIPLSVIYKVVRMDVDAVKQTHNGEILMAGDKGIPLIRLEKQLQLAADNDEASHVIIVTIEGKQYALAVDAIVRQQEIVIQELGPEVGQDVPYLGAAIMGDGSMTLILDITAICLERNRMLNV